MARVQGTRKLAYGWVVAMMWRSVLRMAGVILVMFSGAQSATCQERKITGCEEVIFALTRGYERPMEDAMSEHITKRLLVEAGVSRTAPTVIGWPPFNGFVCVDRRAADLEDVLEESQLGAWGAFSFTSRPTQGDAIRSAARLLREDVVAVGVISRRAYRGALDNRGFVPFHRRTVGVFDWEQRNVPSWIDVRPRVAVKSELVGDELIIVCEHRVFGIVLPRIIDSPRDPRPVAGSVSLLAEAVNVPLEWLASDQEEARTWARIVGRHQNDWLKRWSNAAADVIVHQFDVELTPPEVCAFLSAMARVEVRVGGDALQLPRGGLTILKRARQTLDVHGPHTESVTLGRAELVALGGRQDDGSSVVRPTLRWFVLNAWPWVVVVDTWDERVIQWRD